MRSVIVASAGGSVANVALSNAFFARSVSAVVADRKCGALERAADHGVATVLLRERDKLAFCNRLLEYLLQHDIEYVFSFYTRLFVGAILDVYQDRIINFHPSLLPAFKGLDGFGEAVRFGARFVGSTVHFIDAEMDEGKIIQQTILPLGPHAPLELIRHRLFVQQCKSLLQVARWLADDRLRISGDSVVVLDARYDDAEFSPALDFEDAIDLDVPQPVLALDSTVGVTAGYPRL
jgi:phosphoribosylglycinamide formyltransferase-1